MTERRCGKELRGEATQASKVKQEKKWKETGDGNQKKGTDKGKGGFRLTHRNNEQWISIMGAEERHTQTRTTQAEKTHTKMWIMGAEMEFT